jgi:hypothetical protein
MRLARASFAANPPTTPVLGNLLAYRFALAEEVEIIRATGF